MALWKESSRKTGMTRTPELLYKEVHTLHVFGFAFHGAYKSCRHVHLDDRSRSILEFLKMPRAIPPPFIFSSVPFLEVP